MSVRDIYDDLKSKVTTLFSSKPKEFELPEEGKDEAKTVDFIQQLFDDGLKYEEDHFADTSHMRPTFQRKDNKNYTMSPAEFRKACDSLKANNLYDVIGHRNDTPKTRWRSENVEGLISSNMDVRGNYISSNWHDITITPNIHNINEIFNQERAHKAVGWTEFVDDFREIAQTYGSADCRIEFYDDDEGGHVCVQAVKPGELAITPNAKWIDKKLGGTYCVHGTMINNWQLQELYPELVGEAQASGTLSSKIRFTTRDVTQRGEYQHTKMYPRLEAFLDDDTLEEREFTPEEQSLLADDLDQMTMGAPANVLPEQNHKVHIKAATEALQNFLSSIDEESAGEEDVAFANNVLAAFTAYIETHTSMMDENDPDSMGMRKKYPYGRYVCVVGGKIAFDGQNPNIRQDGYGVPWRKLFHRVYAKKMFGRNDGVGDPETLFHDEKKASIALSRFEDSLVTATPKRYRHINDKLNKETAAQQEDNDQLAVGYFTTMPPVSIAGKVAIEALTMREVSVSKAERARGVNSISIGGEPEGQSSGFQTQLLQRQNEKTITGELDRNLRFTLTEVIEGMFEMYKVWYIGPRPYIINGQYTPVDVSRALSVMTVIDQETGQPVEVPMTKLQITIRPFSNYPNRFEVELAALVEIYNLKEEDGITPLIPSAAIKKFLANKYPEAGENGEWGQLSEATKVGLEVMRQQREAQQAAQGRAEQTQRTIDGVTRQMEKKLIQEQMMGSDNG